MASKLKERKLLEEQRAQDVAKSLASGSRRIRQEAVAKQVEPEVIGAELERKFRERVIRPAATFNRPIKTRDVDAIRLAYACHVFGTFPVPKHIRKVWTRRCYWQASGHPAHGLIGGNNDQAVGRFARGRGERNPAERDAYELMFEVFFLIATGQSVFKKLTKGILSKMETHHLATCPYDLGYAETIVYAIARALVDTGAARSVAATKLSQKSFYDEFWQSAVRFFATNRLPINEVNDLVDYIEHRRRENPQFSLKGRTVEKLKVGHEEWVRELARTKALGNAQWEGLPLDDVTFKTERDRFEWSFTQIRSSKELGAEGTKMRHCVLSYKSKCVRGSCGIFSVKTRTSEHDPWDRALTIEVSSDGEIVQVRGFANRSARVEERLAVRQWAADNQLRIRGYAL